MSTVNTHYNPDITLLCPFFFSFARINENSMRLANVSSKLRKPITNTR